MLILFSIWPKSHLFNMGGNLHRSFTYNPLDSCLATEIKRSKQKGWMTVLGKHYLIRWNLDLLYNVTKLQTNWISTGVRHLIISQCILTKKLSSDPLACSAQYQKWFLISRTQGANSLHVFPAATWKVTHMMYALLICYLGTQSNINVYTIYCIWQIPK
jgi:hypothetical protein